MKKIATIFVFLLLLAAGSYAQDKRPNLTFSNIDQVGAYVSDHFSIDEKIMDTLCLFTSVFVKFNVSEKGKISNLGFTIGTPAFITNALKKAIESTNGHWKIDKSEKRLTTTTYILPVVLYYGLGCKEGTGGIDVNITPERRAREYVKLNNTALNSSYAVQNILDFDTGKANWLRCLILPPISFSANRG